MSTVRKIASTKILKKKKKKECSKRDTIHVGYFMVTRGNTCLEIHKAKDMHYHV